MVSWYLFVMSTLDHWFILGVAVCALSPSSENCYIAYPSRSASTTVFSSSQTSQPYYVNGDIEIFDALSLQLVNIVQAHKSPISNIAMNADGTLLATASEKVSIFKDVVCGYRDWQGWIRVLWFVYSLYLEQTRCINSAEDLILPRFIQWHSISPARSCVFQATRKLFTFSSCRQVLHLLQMAMATTDMVVEVEEW